jgi:MFS family permease
MSALADLPEIVGFFSYSREDDESYRGRLSGLRETIQHELSAQLGRTKTTFRLWQDKEAIAPGRLWETEIKAAVEQSVFFIPIVTPRAINSDYCRFEFEAFLTREHELGRADLVFPILYVPVPALLDEARWRDHPVLSAIAKRQYVDWQQFRHADPYTTAMREDIGNFCRKIVEALNQSWLSPEERREQEAALREEVEHRREEAAAKRRAEQEEQRKREETEARRRTEQEAKRHQAEEEAIKGAEREVAVWAGLPRPFTIESLREFLQAFPNGKNAAVAHAELNALLRAESKSHLERVNAVVSSLKPPTEASAEAGSAWLRLMTVLALGIVGSVSIWSVPASIPYIAPDFGVGGDVTLPYTLAITGFALGGISMMRLHNRGGIVGLLACGGLGIGYAAAAFANSLWPFALAHLLIGVGGSATFAVLVAHLKLWFTPQYGLVLAVAVAASAYYLAGTIWSPLMVSYGGWRVTYLGISIFCVIALPALMLALSGAPPLHSASSHPTEIVPKRSLSLSPHALQILLCLAGFAFGVAASMPQLYFPFYVYQTGIGAEMLSLMLGFSVVSCLTIGFAAGRIDGILILLIASVLQAIALLVGRLFGIVALFVMSVLVGLFQGGMIPCIAIIVREHFPTPEAGKRIGAVVVAILFGMGLGGLISAAILDRIGDVYMLLTNGLAWSLLIAGVAACLLVRSAPIQNQPS